MTEIGITAAIASVAVIVAIVQTVKLSSIEHKQNATRKLLHSASADIVDILMYVSDCNDKITILLKERDELQNKLDALVSMKVIDMTNIRNGYQKTEKSSVVL